ncbi:MAG: hypothetical protein KAU20_01375 [Nanoarchaeota archaeon]|nr:hypothetical protein [Nanoarchaeota archaeon]
MGLFRKKKIGMDLPPPPAPSSDLSPPMVKEFSGGLPPLPKFEESAKLPPLPELPPVPTPLNEERPLPEMPEKKELPSLELPEIKREEEPEEKAAAPVEQEFEIEHPEGHVFVKADKYKGILSSVNVIKRELKGADGCIDRLNELKNRKDKEFEKLRVQLEDIQKRSISVDKSLFGGR